MSIMDKAKLHHLWTTFRRIKPWYFLVLAVLFGLLSFATLRSNYLHMVSLRNAVYEADKDNGDVNGALENLRRYVNGHMNTYLTKGSDSIYPPIQLKYTYDRIVQQHAEQTKDQNKQVYAEAQNACTTQQGDAQTTCIQEYVKQRLVQMGTSIPDGLYKFNFTTPRWSPDLAGLSIVATAVAFLLFVISYLFERWLRTASK